MILDRLPEVLKLTKAEQVELYGELSDLLARSDSWGELSPEVIAELDRRMEEFRHDPSTGKTWEQVKARLAEGKSRA
jgi:putative addiction module component (TIGR02574 family)